MTQSPSTLVSSDLDLGNCILYYNDSNFTSFSAAASSTGWRKLGLMKEGVTMNLTKELLEFFLGFPARLQAQFVQSENMTISGQLLEVNPRNMARVLGGLTITETVKSTSPAATTVATGSTASVVEVADATGYAVGDEIRVGNSGSYQYGRIASISSNTLTLSEILSGNTAPTVGHAVAKIDTTSFELGDQTVPDNIALKISHTIAGGYGTYDLYIPKAQMVGSLEMFWADNTQTQEGIGIPFEVRAISDPNIESGKLAKWIFSQT